MNYSVDRKKIKSLGALPDCIHEMIELLDGARSFGEVVQHSSLRDEQAWVILERLETMGVLVKEQPSPQLAPATGPMDAQLDHKQALILQRAWPKAMMFGALAVLAVLAIYFVATANWSQVFGFGTSSHDNPATTQKTPPPPVPPKEPKAAAAIPTATLPIDREREQAEQYGELMERFFSGDPKGCDLSAYEPLRQALTINPNGWEAMQHLALLELCRDKEQTALSLATDAVEVHESAPWAHLVRGVILQAKNKRASWSAYRRFVKLCPKCRWADEVIAVLRWN